MNPCDNFTSGLRDLSPPNEPLVAEGNEETDGAGKTAGVAEGVPRLWLCAGIGAGVASLASLASPSAGTFGPHLDRLFLVSVPN